ncbi:PAS domain S-box protein [Noviherbaspirillum cavernae]|uniref:PAS domain S-box protein n=1 Tax=Noviherbaspirillum cavernae TaxID=2320862 RepID=A0A418X4W3_9BURK|nr:PAS domain-containing methyl-accepting chemotaxis protein [Noviherbaspirillum cavernae]RJG07421.1 PAS domain S-box protein [Noviherbaspirillum cavernae]
MRNNLPVTNTEYALLDGLSIVSKTDTKGKITYVNPYFIEVSGFSEDELLGAPHNIVRHPDMPPEAFADMWETLKEGLPWTALVKNRRKNGDHYWVQANVTPVREGGRTVGYMSVRTKPSRAEVEAAEILYRELRTGTAKDVAIRRGAVVHTGLKGRIASLRHMPLRLRIGLNLGLIGAGIATLGVAAWSSHAGTALSSWIAGATVAGLLVCARLWHILSVSVVRPLRDVTDVARAIAGGDLSNSFESSRNDDMGQLVRALQQMNVNLQSIIGDVRANVASIRTGTREIASGNIDLSGRTESQAASLEETASSMEELAATVKQNADNATQANQLAMSASQIAGKGGTAVAQVGATMSEISESARKIVDIIGLIDSIAFQTNILALNAAVEAARAGEQGRGFAVVASEVRHLAQRSASAAKEIKTLIDDSVDKVENGNRLVDDAMRTMEEIVTSVKHVTDIMGEISTASREQSQGIDQANQAISSMDQATQQNAALVEQAAASAARLDEETMRLEQSVAVFKLARDVTQPVVRAKSPAAPSATLIQMPRKPAAQPALRQGSVARIANRK